MTFEEIAPIVDRSVVATRQLASRARRQVRGQAPTSDADLRTQRRVVDAVQTGDQYISTMPKPDPVPLLKKIVALAKNSKR
jgi:hypothetical protein